MLTVSEYIVQYLKGKGIDTAFAVIGSTAMWLFNALGKEKGIHSICTNHEQSAVMAADGWSCITGKPGIVFLTNGPGVTNALSGLAQAWTDSVPLIVINGESKSSVVQHEINTGMRQYGPQSVRTDIIVSPFVKYYHFIDNPLDTRKVLEKAYHIALEGRPGPVWISVPVDVQNVTVQDEIKEDEFLDTKAQMYDEEKLGIIQEMIVASKKPLIIAGQGIRQSHSKDMLGEFVQKYKIPIVTSRMGNDIIMSDNPLFVGRPGNWGNRAAHFAIQSADLILVLGSRLSLNTTGHTPSGFAPNAKKVVVDIDSLEFDKPGIDFDVCLNLDLNTFFSAMKNYDCFSVDMDVRFKWVKKCQDWKEKYPVVLESYKRKQPLSTYHFIDRLSLYSSPKDIILSDTGSCCNIVSQVWNVKENQRVLLSGGLSCMGYWVTAIGAASANKKCLDNNVICIVGDGSLQMNIQELGTIVHYNIPIKLIVINNNGYQIIRISQASYMHGQFFAISPETGVGLANTERIAKAYGIAYKKIITLQEVDSCIKWALEYNGPVVLEVVVAEDQIMLPRLTSKVQDDGTFKSAKYEDLAPFLGEDELKENLKG